MAKRYEVTGAPASLGEPGSGQARLATAREVAAAARLPERLVQRRLSLRGWRDWPRLAQSPGSASRAAQRQMASLMGGETQARRQEAEGRASALRRTRAGHKAL